MNPRLLKKPHRMMLAALGCLALSVTFGCGSIRVVTVPTTEPRQLAETVKAYVYVKTADGKRIRSANRTPLNEGEWVLSDPGDQKQ